MKFIVYVVMVVSLTILGGMAFDCLQESMTADAAKLQQGKMEREYGI